MLTGAVEVVANHPIVLIGSTGWPEVEWGDGPVGADARHVAVLTRGQVAATKVSIWEETMPLVGHQVFDGELDLDDYTIFVGDIERLRRWTQRIGRTGVQRVIVRVDDPGRASRVNVGLGIDADAVVQALPSRGEPLLFEALTSARDGMSVPNARGLVLDAHDSPHERLAAAVTLLSPPDPARPWLEGYEVEGIVEWLRWLGADLRRDRAEAAGAEILRRVRNARESLPAGTAIPAPVAHRIASEAIRSITSEPT